LINIFNQGQKKIFQGKSGKKTKNTVK
jgi:hypothetical protein